MVHPRRRRYWSTGEETQEIESQEQMQQIKELQKENVIPLEMKLKEMTIWKVREGEGKGKTKENMLDCKEKVLEKRWKGEQEEEIDGEQGK